MLLFLNKKKHRKKKSFLFWNLRSFSKREKKREKKKKNISRCSNEKRL